MAVILEETFLKRGNNSENFPYNKTYILPLLTTHPHSIIKFEEDNIDKSHKEARISFKKRRNQARAEKFE